MFESISFSLSTAIVSGNNYDLTFFAANSNPVGSESLRVGVSTIPTSFGTQATVVPLGLNGAYTQYSITFTAPENGAYLTIEPAALGEFWFGLDDFSLELSSALSVTELTTNENIKIFPNPSSNFIQISGISERIKFKIINVLGAEIKNGIASNNKKIDIRDFTNGLYFLKFENGNTIKFLKE